MTPAGILVAAANSGGGDVHIYAVDSGELLHSFAPFGPDFGGGVRVATGDISGDRLGEVLVAAGPGGGPHVRVFDALTGAELRSFFAFDPGFTGGVYLTAGDVDGDGADDVIAAAGEGGGPHVKVFSGRDGSLMRNFFAFDPGFRGGVRVAAADLNGDGRAEVIAGAGPGGGPHVRTFDGATGEQLAGPLGSFFAFDPALTGGVSVAAGRRDTDGTPDLAVGAGPGGGPHVKLFGGADGAEQASFFAFDPDFRGGVEVAAGDSPDLPENYFFASAGPGGGPHVRGFAAHALAPDPAALSDGETGAPAVDNLPGAVGSFFAFDPAFAGGVSLAASHGTNALVRAGLASYWEGRTQDLVRTNNGTPPDGLSYHVQNTFRPNVTRDFLDRGLPVQTTDWWSPMLVRSANFPDDPNNWPGPDEAKANNLPINMYANPLVLSLSQDQSLSRENLQFSLGQNHLVRTFVGNHFLLGNNPPGPGGNNATDVTATLQPAPFNTTLDVQVGIFDPDVPPPSPTAQRAVPATAIAVDNYSDWGATFSWADAATRTMRMNVTGLAGSPYTYFTKSEKGNVELYFGIQRVIDPEFFTATPRILLNRGEVLVVAVPQMTSTQALAGFTYYGVFAPAGSSWDVTTATTDDGRNTQYPAKVESDLNGKTYFSVAALPQSIVQNDQVDEALLETFRKHAYAFPADPPSDPATGPVGSTRVVPEFDPATGLLTTTLQVTTRLMEPGVNNDNVNAAPFALYPHQYKNLAADSLRALAASPDVEYPSALGTQRLLIPDAAPLADTGLSVSSFRTELRYRGGVLPVLPDGIPDAAARANLIRYLEQVANAPFDQVFGPGGVGNFNTLTDTYDSGKEMLRVANLLPLFDQITPDAEYTAERLLGLRDQLLDQVKRFLVNWFDASDYHFFLHDTVWDTILGFQDGGFGSVTTNNDHHFHYGYFIKTAALIARYDPAFVSSEQFGPILTLLAKDVANWDRADTRFPFLRHFNPYFGHSFADGVGLAQDGNNQESSSEAMNFASGLILLGEAVMNFDPETGRRMRDTGIYLFTTEEESIGQYWFNVDGDNFPANFTDSYDATTLTANIDATQTTVRVQANGSASTEDLIRLPKIVPFVVQVDRELMLVTAIAPGPTINTSSGNTVTTYDWTVVRGIEGTAAAPHRLSNNPNADFATMVNQINLVSVKSPLFRKTTLAAPLAAGTAGDPAEIEVADPAAFPASGPFLVSVGGEVLLVTAGAGTTRWTAQRGQYGTPAGAHAAGDTVRLISPTVNTALGRVAGGALFKQLFFADDSTNRASSLYAINWFPVNASMLYLGRYRRPDGSSYPAANYQALLWAETFMFVNDPNDDIYFGRPYLTNVGGVPKGTPGQGGAYPGNTWAYQAFSDPQGALAAIDRFVIGRPMDQPDLINTTPFPGNNGFDNGESVAFTYHFIHSLLRFGAADPEVYATAADADAESFLPTYAVFRHPQTGERTYVAFNPGTSAARTLTFHNPDGTTVTLEVPAGSYAYQTGADPGTRVTVGPPLVTVSPAAPASRFFLRAGEGQDRGKTFLSQQPGAFQQAVVLPNSPTPGDVAFASPAVFEISGVSGTPLDPGSNPTQRTQFSLQVINSLFFVPPDNEQGAQVLARVKYFADATAETPFREEVWSPGPQFATPTDPAVPGFNTVFYFQEYRSVTWFDRAPGNEDLWFKGTYQPMNNGRVRLEVYTLNPNFLAGAVPAQPDFPNTQVGLRTDAAAAQFGQSYLQIPYTNVMVG